MNRRTVVAITAAILVLVAPACVSHGADPVTIAQASTHDNSAMQGRDCVATGAMLPIIPLPRTIIRTRGSFMFPNQATISVNSRSARNIALILIDQVRPLGLRVAEGQAAAHSTIRLTLEAAAADVLGHEGYHLTVGRKGVSIIAAGGAGLFYGLQTFEQLASRNGRSACTIPYMSIVDWPQYSWRGIHLDVSRHFFPVAVVEQYIDLAARYKLNTFHWHLTDDQGWRIEIRSYPLLTSVGACRDGTQIGGYDSGTSDNIRNCGFYTQQEIREVVAYAQARFVTIVPEIEGPGHSVEVLAAYPDLACSSGPFSTLTLWGSTKYSVCPTERTFEFYDGVIREIAQLFPSTMIHIGGDEVPYYSWRISGQVGDLMRRERLSTYSAVQRYFTRRIERLAGKYHRRIVGWDEIESTGVSRNAVVMAWSGNDAGRTAAHRGNDVVMTPHPQLYFDGYQGSPVYEPAAIGGSTATPVTLQTVYNYDPTPPGLSAEDRVHILGAQGNLWTEYVPTRSHLWYMAFPKVIALAELCWTPRAQMDWASFTQRLGPNLQRLETGGIPFRIPEVSFRVEATVGAGPMDQVNRMRSVASERGPEQTVALESTVPDATILYTVDGTLPTRSSRVYRHALHLAQTGGIVHFTAIAMLSDRRSSAPSFFDLNLR